MTPSSVTANGGISPPHLYSDIRGLQSINKLQRENSAAALNESAKQFESLLVQLMLKSMRAANSTFSEGNYLSGDRVGFYQQMLDDQWSVGLTRGAGLGLSEQIVRHLSSALSSSPPLAASDAADQAKLVQQKYSVSSGQSLGSAISLRQ